MLDSLSFFIEGVTQVLADPVTLAYVTGGVLVGTIVGMIPGLGPSTAIALLLPLAMTMEASNSLVLMVAIYLGAEYGGRISSILLNIPGDAGAIMTALDGHPMAKNGEGARALQLSAIASFFGSVIATIGLVLLVAPLANLAIQFGPTEYFAVVIMALVLASTLVGGGFRKSFIAVCLGLMIATVGVDSQTGAFRFTYNIQGLLGGIDLIIVIIGLFGVGEVLYTVAQSRSREFELLSAKGSRVSRADVGKTVPTMGSSSILGFIAGILPGSGTTLGGFLGYSAAKQAAKDDSQFGKGDPRGLVAPEAANNAAVGGSMVPTLALGIPGSGVTAILLAYLMIYGLNPGPTFFDNQPDLAWLIIGALAVSALIGFILNLPLAPLFSSVLNIPGHYLYAFIMLIAFTSGYGLHGSIFEAALVVIFGVIGFGLRLVGLSSALVVIGVVLGSMLEKNMRQGYLLAYGDISKMLLQPVPLIFFGIAAVALIMNLFGSTIRNRIAMKTHPARSNQNKKQKQNSTSR